MKCEGFSDTDWLYPVWGSSTRLTTQTLGGFRGNEALVVAFQVPANAPVSTGSPSRVTVAEWIDLGQLRQAFLSTKPCDFSTTTLLRGSYTSDTSIYFSFDVGTVKRSSSVPIVAPGTWLYLNLRNANPAGCPNSCNVFTLISP